MWARIALAVFTIAQYFIGLWQKREAQAEVLNEQQKEVYEKANQANDIRNNSTALPDELLIAPAERKKQPRTGVSVSDLLANLPEPERSGFGDGDGASEQDKGA